MTELAPARPTANHQRMAPALAFATAVIAPAVVAVAVSAAVASIAHAAGVSHDFKALTVATYTPFVVIGLLAGAIAWVVIRRRSTHPAALLRWLAPTVVAVSLIPDIIVGMSKSLPGSSWGGVAALMVMHLVVAVCGVVSYRTFLPLAGSTPRP